MKSETLKSITKRSITWYFASFNDLHVALQELEDQCICSRGNGQEQFVGYDFGDGETILTSVKIGDKRFYKMVWEVDYTVSIEEIEEWERLERLGMVDDFDDDNYGDWMSPCQIEGVKTYNTDGSDANGEAAEWGRK